MHQKQYQAHDQGNVNESAGYVKREESKQPKNDQNCGDDPKHVLSPCDLCDLVFPNGAEAFS
jgi:hypothetical protein